jgi:hypothetical protein
MTDEEKELLKRWDKEIHPEPKEELKTNKFGVWTDMHGNTVGKSDIMSYLLKKWGHVLDRR